MTTFKHGWREFLKIMTYDTINDAVTLLDSGGETLLVGRYRVVRQLGQGGMGSVWLAEDTQLDNKLFAVKMLPAILVRNKRAYRQLKDEALVAMKLTHPNIVTLRAFEENNGNPFLVMDYIDGQTLDDYLAEKGKLSEDEALRVLRPVAAALDYAHAKGVVHRDVKPGNVMIAKDGTPYILDFGIAREIQETLTRVTGKLSSGTLLYMSPEQLNGDQPKPAQDVYSFAAMVYECLKGEPPFVRGAIEDQIKNKQPGPLPTDALTGNAAILAAGVMEGLAKKPEDRPATSTAVLEGSVFSRKERKERKDVVANGNGLVGHVEGGKGRARSSSGPQPEGSRPVAALKALLAVAALALVVAGSWWRLSGRKEINRPKTEEERKAATAISIEAKVRRGKINRNVSDEHGFKKKKDDLEDLFDNADKLLDAKKWNEASQQFTTYTNECNALEKLDAERNRAVEARVNANVAKGKAEDAEAEKYANDRWNSAVELMKSASSQFAASQFGEAVSSFSLAITQFDKCTEEASDERNRQEIEAKKRAEEEASERARRAKWRKEGGEFTIDYPDGMNMKMKWCPATTSDEWKRISGGKGYFTMGSPITENGRTRDERQHEVTLTKGFWLGETEVTQGQWKKIMDGETVVDLVLKGLRDDTLYNFSSGKKTLRDLWGMTKYGNPKDRCGDLKDNIPVYNVSWNEAVEFCRRLTKQERKDGRIPDGYEYRLPTEAEWEYACRAGTTTALPNGRDILILGERNAPLLDDIAWYGGNSSYGFNGVGWNTDDWSEKQYPGGNAAPREVKGKLANDWKLYDMIGNVWEWCNDCYGTYPFGSVTDPTGPFPNEFCVIRGGSWGNSAWQCRSARRYWEAPSFRDYYVGFRIALAPSHRIEN